jgi:hypothetical protein
VKLSEMMRVVRLFIGISIIAGWGCGGCDNHILSQAISPDGKYRAVVFERDCGATTGFSTQVSIMPAGRALGNNAGNAFIADDNHGTAPAGRGGGPEINIVWMSPTQLTIRHHSKAYVFKAETQIGTVQIKYEDITN